MIRQKAHDRMIPLKNLVLDKRCQLRADLRQTVIQDYADVLEEAKEGDGKWPFPEVVVFYQEGSAHFVADGWHRVLAARQTKWPGDIPCEVLHGTLRDAILYAAGANSRHGIRRTNEDKRQAVLTILKDREWRKWNSAEIARHCAVSPGLVEIIRWHEGGAANPAERIVFGREGRLHYRKRENDRRIKRVEPALTMAEVVTQVSGASGPGTCPYCGRKLDVD